MVALMATAAALARVALDRELSIRLAVLIALCAAALLHVFSAVGAAYALVLGLLLLAVALVEGRGVVAIGRLAGAGVAIAVLAVAVNLSDVTSFAEHAGDTFASEGGASTAYLGHLHPAAPSRSGGGRLVLARLPRARAAAVRDREHHRRRRDRAPGAGGHRAGAAPEATRRAAAADSDGGGGGGSRPSALAVRGRQAPRRPVAGGRPDGRDRRICAAGEANALDAGGRGPRLWRSWSSACSCPTAWATAWPRWLRRSALDAMTDAADHATGDGVVAGQRVGGVRQVLHARHQGQRRLRGRVAEAGRDAQAASDLRSLLRPRRPDARVRGQLSRHHQAALAGGEPAAGLLRAVVRQRLLRGLEASGRTHGDRAPSTPAASPCHRPARLRRRPSAGRPGPSPATGWSPPPARRSCSLDPLNAGLRPRGWVPNVEPPGTVTPVTPGEMRFVPTHRAAAATACGSGEASAGRRRCTSMAARWAKPTRSTRPGSGSRSARSDLDRGIHRVKLERPGAFRGTGRRLARRARPSGARTGRAHRDWYHGLARARRLACVGATGTGSSWCVHDGAGRRSTRWRRPASGLCPSSSTARSCTPSTSRATWSPPSSPSRGACSTPPAARATGPRLLAAAGATSARGSRPRRAHRRACPRRAIPRRSSCRATSGELPFEDGAFDLVVSFETIEHVRDPEAVLDELRRVLADDGLLLISTPNKHQYLVDNEFHEREFTARGVRRRCCRRAFRASSVLLQHNWLASACHARRRGARCVGRARPARLAFREAHRDRARRTSSTRSRCAEAEQLPSRAPVVVAAGLDEVARARTAARRRGADRREMAPRVRGGQECGRELARPKYQSAADRRLRLRLVAHDGTAALACRPREATEMADPVTVAIPVRNGGGLLGDVLESVARAAARSQRRAARGRLRLDRRLAHSSRVDHGAEVIDVPVGRVLARRHAQPSRSSAPRVRTSLCSPRTRCRPTIAGSRGCSRASRWPTTWGSSSGATGHDRDASVMVRRELDEWFDCARARGSRASGSDGEAMAPAPSSSPTPTAASRATPGSRSRFERSPTRRTSCSLATCWPPGTRRSTVPTPP